ncbi:hypothetical protein ACFV0X_39365, partial [Streptomyces mirabilis]
GRGGVSQWGGGGGDAAPPRPPGGRPPRGGDSGVPYWLAAASPLVGLLAYLGARLLWRWSLGHYSGVNG